MRGTVDGKRVYLSPVSEWEMQKQLDAGEKRYEEILKACRKDPDRWYWYTDWTVHSKLIGCPVGTIRFGGPPQGGVLSLTCEIKEQYRRQGYGAEAVQAALQWANRRGDMYFTRVQVEDAAGKALARKLQFKSLPGKAGVWITERPRAKWLAGYLLVGLMIGLMIGQLMKAATQGTIIGAGVGLVLGVVLFLRDAKLRRGVRERLLAENQE